MIDNDEMVGRTVVTINESIYVFYQDDSIVGITDTVLIDNQVSIHNIFADSLDIMAYIIMYVSNKYQKDITISCDTDNKILNDVLSKIDVEIVSSRYNYKTC